MPVLKAGLIGDNISRTRLPAALRILCDQVGWDLDFNLIDTAGRSGFDFDATVDHARSEGWTGVTVTHPHKTLARAYAGDGMHGDVAHLGASNTLVFGPDLTGFNTDYTGFLSVLESNDLGLLGDVVLVGAGGVAEALGPACAERLAGTARLRIFDIDMGKASALADKIGSSARALPMSDLDKAIGSADGVINSTPLGMKEHPGSAIPTSALTARTAWAFDAVYTPTNTAFITGARAAGIRCITGFELFRAMAVRSFQAYTGLSVPQDDVLPQLDALRPE